jgi:hypothetical protein
MSPAPRPLTLPSRHDPRQAADLRAPGASRRQVGQQCVFGVRNDRSPRGLALVWPRMSPSGVRRVNRALLLISATPLPRCRSRVFASTHAPVRRSAYPVCAPLGRLSCRHSTGSVAAGSTLRGAAIATVRRGRRLDATGTLVSQRWHILWPREPAGNETLSIWWASGPLGTGRRVDTFAAPPARAATVRPVRMPVPLQ